MWFLRRPLLFLLFSMCFHLSFSPETFSLSLTNQSLLQSFQLFRTLCGLLRRLDTFDVLVILVVGAHNVVAPTEGGGEIVHESHVVEIVVVSTSPEGKDVLKRPGKIVSAVSIDSLEETENDPDVHGEDMKVSGAKNVKDRASDRSGAEDKDFSWVGVFSS